MAVELNGYNATFQQFVDFAQKRMSVGDEEAIANAEMSGDRLSGRSIVSIDSSKTDKVGFFGALFRSQGDIHANVKARYLFMESVKDMFGGNIPPSVKEAMELKDFDAKGHPLTARRIIAVQNAIDATGILRAKALAKDPGFSNPATEALAIQKGCSRAELFAVARAIRYYQSAMNCDEATAAREVLTSGSKANRLLQYGGRFLASQDNFKEGLRLLDSFAGWYTNLQGAQDFILVNNRDYNRATTISELNVSSRSLETGKDLGYERFVFQQIAHDPDFNLKETDAERAFGFENNAASRFIGRDLCPGRLCTVNAVPPDKRRILFAAFDALVPLAKNVDEANRQVSLQCESLLLARVMKNIDRLAILDDKGQLTAKNIMDICFPDMPNKGRYDVKALNNFSRYCQDTLGSKLPPDKIYQAIGEMESTGATLDEVVNAVNSGRSLPKHPFYSPMGYSLRDNDGSTAHGRSELSDSLGRLSQYSSKTGEDLLPPEALVWNVTFPGGNTIPANGTTHAEGIDAILNGVEALCGEIHKPQANAVMFNLSQAALIPYLSGGFPEYGIGSREHSPVNFALSKDADTGAITIRYSSPDGLPIHFSWETVIDIDGNTVNTTPFTVTRQ